MKYDINTYVTVAERLAMAQGQITDIMTGAPTMLSPTHGYIQTVIRLRDGRQATGTASFRLDLIEALRAEGRKPTAQATNPVEDAETSAVGRALALLGWGIERGIASQDEITEARRRADLVTGRVGTSEARGGYTRVELAEGGTYVIRGQNDLADGQAVTLRPTGTTTRTGLPVADLIAA